MQEDTKDLVAITILITVGVAVVLLMLWADAIFFGACLGVLGAIAAFFWALTRVFDLYDDYDD